MSIDYPSEQQDQQEHEPARQETSRSRLSSRVTRQSEVNEQDKPQAHNAQENARNEQGPSCTAQERLIWCEEQIYRLLDSCANLRSVVLTIPSRQFEDHELIEDLINTTER